jgi:hypothetical protein
MLGKKTTEESFNRRIYREIDKVVNVETEGQWHQCDDGRRIRGVTYKSCIEKWVLERWGETNQLEGVNFVIPMPQAVPKSIKRPFKEPIFIMGGFGLLLGGQTIVILSGRRIP